MKKFLTVLLALCLMATLIPTAALGTNKSQKVSLEEAIKIAKKHFKPGQEFDQFDSSYEQNDFANVWSLRWSSSKGQGEMNVRIDVETGEVVGYNYYNPKDYESSSSIIPKVSKKEGEKIALDFIKQVAPSKAKNIVLKPNTHSYYGGPLFYNYTFYRLINGVEYPTNNINIDVNAQTGKVTNFYCQWENLAVSPLQPKLTLAEAQKKFNEEFGFELRYFKPTPYRAENKSIKLVYEISNPYFVAIDALTGEIVYDGSYYPYFRAGEAMDLGEAAAKEALEPFEQEVVNQLKGLISKEKALEIAKKTIELPKYFRLYSSGLHSDWNFPELKIWSFYWNYEGKNHYGWASVEIDAKTGKVLAFSFNENKYDEEGNDLLKPKEMVVKTRAEAEKIVQDFLKANYPETVGNLRLKKDEQYEILPIVSVTPEVVNNQKSYFFNYERIVNGIPYAQNYVNITVDAYTGKISDFRIRFTEEKFPGTEKVLNKDKFVSDFFKKHPMQLFYIKDKNKNLRLVYKLPPLTSYRFDAVTGEMLNWLGEVIKDTSTQELNGISGHPAEQDIRILHELGLLYVQDGFYNPDEPLTQAELIKMLVKSNNSYINDSNKGNWYDNYYNQAKSKGLILEDEVAPQKAISREEMAKFLVRTLVWDKIATLAIYQVPEFNDKDKISQGYEGYIAIINGLGLMTAENNNFNPQAQVKKGEACSLMVKYLNMER